MTYQSHEDTTTRFIRAGIGLALGFLMVRVIFATLATLTVLARDGSTEMATFWLYFHNLNLL